MRPLACACPKQRAKFVQDNNDHIWDLMNLWSVILMMVGRRTAESGVSRGGLVCGCGLGSKGQPDLWHGRNSYREYGEAYSSFTEHVFESLPVGSRICSLDYFSSYGVARSP